MDSRWCIYFILGSYVFSKKTCLDSEPILTKEPKRNINRNQTASNTSPGIVDNPYYEGSDDVLSIPGVERSANSGIERLTVTENLYYEE